MTKKASPASLRVSHAPILEALINYQLENNATFHVPGHKNGQVYKNDVDIDPLKGVMTIDATEITGLDDLHHPEGVIQEAQALAAECFGAEDSFLLIGGSTVGNLALILTVCTEPGDILLVQRNVHKSVINGLMLAGANAVFLDPELEPMSGLAIAPSEYTVAAALAAYPKAKGLFITMPNYYGMGSDLTPLARMCHAAGVPLLVDEAHGAHFGHHPNLPASALSCGADGVVQSTHKMLSAMTMGAMLHVQGGLLRRDVLRQRLAMIQSSSPSYPLMASLDAARRYLHVHGANAFTAGLAAVQFFREGLLSLPRFRILGPLAERQQTVGEGPITPQRLKLSEKEQAPDLVAFSYTMQDPFKIVLYDGEGVLDGYELQRELEAQNCVPEMSDERFVVLLFSLGSTLEDANHLLRALKHIHENKKFIQSEDNHASRAGSFSTWNNYTKSHYSVPVSFSLKLAASEHIESVQTEQCAGRIAAEMVIPYPPGIPLVYPGELISEGAAQRIGELSQSGAKCQGTADSTLCTVRVYKETNAHIMRNSTESGL